MYGFCYPFYNFWILKVRIAESAHTRYIFEYQKSTETFKIEIFLFGSNRDRGNRQVFLPNQKSKLCSLTLHTTTESCPLHVILIGSYVLSKNLVDWCNDAITDIQATHLSTLGIVHHVLATGAWHTYMYLRKTDKWVQKKKNRLILSTREKARS